MTNTQKWMQGEETVPYFSFCGATGLPQWHLKVSHAQLGSGKSSLLQSLPVAPRGPTPALGGGK